MPIVVRWRANTNRLSDRVHSELLSCVRYTANIDDSNKDPTTSTGATTDASSPKSFPIVIENALTIDDGV